MSSSVRSEAQMIDLDRDVPTTPDDIRALRHSRAHLRSWLEVDPGDLDAWLPQDALTCRPPARDTWEPFSLE